MPCCQSSRRHGDDGETARIRYGADRARARRARRIVPPGDAAAGHEGAVNMQLDKHMEGEVTVIALARPSAPTGLPVA